MIYIYIPNTHESTEPCGFTKKIFENCVFCNLFSDGRRTKTSQNCSSEHLTLCSCELTQEICLYCCWFLFNTTLYGLNDCIPGGLTSLERRSLSRNGEFRCPAIYTFFCDQVSTYFMVNLPLPLIRALWRHCVINATKQTGIHPKRLQT